MILARLWGLRVRVLFLVVIALIPAFATTSHAAPTERHHAIDGVLADVARLAQVIAADQHRVVGNSPQTLAAGRKDTL